MDEKDFLATRFEQQRPQLKAVAYRMLGSQAEAEDAVQETWLRLARADAGEIDNLGGWLTTVVARVALNMLRSRRTRGEEPLDLEAPRMPDPLIAPLEGSDPEREALLADGVGLALFVVLEQLAPAERLAFVLHDMFAVPFEEIAAIVDRSPEATRQLASRARRRVRGEAPQPDCSLEEQRRVVDAFFAASRDGDFDKLLAVLDPDVVIRSDGGARRPSQTLVIHGAENVASRAQSFRGLGEYLRPALVNGVAGAVVAPKGTPYSVLGFIVRGGRIVEIDAIADPDKLATIDLTVLDV